MSKYKAFKITTQGVGHGELQQSFRGLTSRALPTVESGDHSQYKHYQKNHLE